MECFWKIFLISFLQLTIVRAETHFPVIDIDSNLTHRMLRSLMSSVDDLEVFNINYNAYSESAIESQFRRIYGLRELTRETPVLVNALNKIVQLGILYSEIADCIESELCPLKNRFNSINQIINTSSTYREALGRFEQIFIADSAVVPSNQQFSKVILNYFLAQERINHNCGFTESNRMRLVHIYNKILMVILKNYSLLYLTKNRLKNFNKMHNDDIERSINNIEYTTTKLKIFFDFMVQDRKKLLVQLSPIIRLCDPPKHIEHSTYERLTYFIQAFLGSEKFLNKNHECGHQCKSISTTSMSRQIQSQTELMYIGKIFNCTVAPDFDYIYKQYQPDDLERFYHHLESEKNKSIVYGKKAASPDIVLRKYPRIILHGAENTTIYNGRNCDVCLCYVDRDLSVKAVRTFSKQPVKLPQGHVVTGVRLAVKNQVVFLELQGTKLNENGLAIPSSSKWFTSDSNDSSILYDGIYLSAERRSINLDNVKVPWGKFIVGAGFIRINDTIHLVLQAKSLDKEQVLTEYDTWHHSGNDLKRKRVEIELNQPDASEFAPVGENRDQSESTDHSFFVNFQPTSFVKDAAQTTVPYIDVREVVSNPPVPLQAIGLYYRGQNGYGGFIAPKISIVESYSTLQMSDLTTKAFAKIDTIIDFHSRCL